MRLYGFTSRNGVKFRILDTPGLADIRGVTQNEKYEASMIVEAVLNMIPSVDAVVVVANGATSRLGATTFYALWSLSSMFPRSLAENVAVLLTHVPNVLGCGLTQGALPEWLRGDNFRPFYIDNPVALWKRYGEMRLEQSPSEEVAEAEEVLRTAHKQVLKEMVKFFDWVVDVKPQLAVQSNLVSISCSRTRSKTKILTATYSPPKKPKKLMPMMSALILGALHFGWLL